MKKKIMIMLLATAMTMSTISGCGEKGKESSVSQEEIKKESVHENTLEEMKHYVKDIENLAILKGTKNIDLSEAVGKLISSEKNKEVKKVSVDDSKIDYDKTGKYPADIKIELKNKVLKDTVDITVVTKEELEKDRDLVLIGRENQEEANVDKKKKDNKTESGQKKDKNSSSNVADAQTSKSQSKPGKTTTSENKPQTKPETKPTPENKPQPKPEPQPTPENKPAEKPHEHTWVPNVIEEAWVEENWKVCSICSACGVNYDLEGYSLDQIYEHEKAHALNGENSGHYSDQVLVGTIPHDAVIDGYICSSCGAKKQ